MNYIINPSVFYWMNVVYGLNIMFVLFLTLSCIVLIVYLFALLMDDLPFDEDNRRVSILVFRVTIAVFIVSLLGSLFVPTKQTIMEMLVAKMATVENAEWTVDTLKQFVDYIVQAAQGIK